MQDAVARARDDADQAVVEPSRLAVRRPRHTLIDGKRFELERFDTVAIPGVRDCRTEFVNDAADPMILFRGEREPALCRVRLLNRYGKSASGEVVK
jgi:hypothetical protein